MLISKQTANHAAGRPFAGLPAVVLCLASVTAWADVVTVGAIRTETDNPSLGLTSFIVSNITGPGCDATFNSCTALAFDNGLLTVHYSDPGGAHVFTASLPNGFGPGDSDPSFFFDFTVDASQWTIQTVSFSGTLSPSSAIFLFGGASASLQPNTFSGSYDAATATAGWLTAATGPPAPVPEPSSIGFFVTAAVVCIQRFRRPAKR